MAAIELSGLTKDYGEVLANDDVSFAVERGEVFGYLGPNGAGKTTTIRILLGLISPTAGSAELLGRDVTDESALIEAKRRVGYLPDDPQFDESATGREVLDLHARIKGDERSEALLELFDPPLDRQVREYSHGNVRKLGLVTTFMHDPELVVLDEPTSGLDPLMKQRFAEFVREEVDRGLTVFLSSHILGEVRRLCDRVAIIREGRLVTVEPVGSLVHRSGKVVRLRAPGRLSPDRFDLPGVQDLETSVVRAESGTVTDCTFTFAGEVGPLLDRLHGLDPVDCTIEEAPLEDVFMRFYDGSSGDDPASAPATDGQGSPPPDDPSASPPAGDDADSAEDGGVDDE